MNRQNGESPHAAESTPAASNTLKDTIWPGLVAILCLTLFAIKAITSMVQESSTWDETCYFGLGKYLLQNRKWDVPGSILHPPLSYYIHSIPLLLFPTDRDLWKSDPARVNDLEYLGNSPVLRGQELLSRPENAGDRELNLSRLMMVLTGILLGWFVYRWSYSLYGKWSAVLAVILFSFSPDFLAHAHLITPDITLATFLFITMYYFWRLLGSGSVADAMWGGVSLGLALLSKFTAVLLFPVLAVLVVLWVAKSNPVKISRLALFLTVGFCVFCLGYGGHLGGYWAGVAYQHKHTHAAFRRFMLGHYSTTGWWYYFLVVFLVKTPLAEIAILAIATFWLIKKLPSNGWLNEAFLFLPAAAIFGFFSVSNWEMGARYLLPTYPFLFVFASGAAEFLLSRKVLTGALALMTLWYIGASCYIHPHYLAYFNELAGGPNNGYKCLVDSNLDWGQDLKGLKAYMQENNIAKVSLSYFGSDTPERYGIAYDWLPSFVLHDPNPTHHTLNAKGWIAVSATNLQGVYLDDISIFAWLKARRPVAKIGYSIFIYKVDD